MRLGLQVVLAHILTIALWTHRTAKVLRFGIHLKVFIVHFVLRVITRGSVRRQNLTTAATANKPIPRIHMAMDAKGSGHVVLIARHLDCAVHTYVHYRSSWPGSRSPPARCSY